MGKDIFRTARRSGWVFGLAVILVFTLAANSSAASGKNKPKSVSKAAILSSEVDQDKKMNALKEAAIKLNNTSWEIQLSQISTAKEKESVKDTLRFADYKFTSDRLSPDGFGASSFTMSMPHENVVVWETMQDSGKNGFALWKGELVEGDEVMRGVLSRHLNDNAQAVKEYTFVSVKKEILTPDDSQETAKAQSPEAK